MSERPSQTLPLTSARHVPDRTWHARPAGSLTVGERAADVMRNGMGSWRFVFAFLAFMAVWALLNSVSRAWDPYPFILLNLFLSMLAGLQGAILLIAAKRQDAVTADLAQHDYDTNIAAKEDVEALLRLHSTQVEMLEQVLGRLASLEHGAGGAARP
ncbi:DUF1003 domain-containing protein [uncultured Phycicoccus sp.]|uniref:DUF1003 domain-containing protein n=1 Tax=uncultured Phycicoccus sp. TaxID=661422 RepID=UPI00345BD583